MDISLFDFDLSPELIAQYPAERRDLSRMMVLWRTHTDYHFTVFREIIHYLQPGDCLVFNNTKVIPARLFGKKLKTGGKVELLLLEPTSSTSSNEWYTLIRPGRGLQPGAKIEIGPDLICEYKGREEEERHVVQFPSGNLWELLEQYGHIPLPPYIRRKDNPQDAVRYQTVYAQQPGSVAAPTAGLHFTPEILSELKKNGIHQTFLTLHVGMGTFKPVKTQQIENHKMHREWFMVSPETAGIINQTRAQGKRVIAVGTTTVRTLETVWDPENKLVRSGQGYTNIFLYPPYKIQSIDGLLTNFHLPRSTLLMLVSCFIDRERLLQAYQIAIRERMRFFSYGDCMLIL